MINIKNYDVYHLGISGGKDSTAALLWTLFESDIPKNRLIVTFCDTGNEDNFTYEFLKILGEFHRIFYLKPDKNFYELALDKGRFPSRKARFCTHFLKIIPSREFILFLLRSNLNPLNMTGIRKSEGSTTNNRGNLKKLSFDDSLGCDVFHPLYDLSINDVWRLHKKYLSLERIVKIIENDPFMISENKSILLKRIKRNKIPRNPLYDLGASRVGCYPCINNRKLEIRSIAKYRPERIDAIEKLENSFDNLNHFSSFFSKKMTPIEFRSKTVLNATGEKNQIPTIRDVVKWSKTKKNQPWQFELDLDFSDQSVCDLRGYCE